VAIGNHRSAAELDNSDVAPKAVVGELQLIARGLLRLESTATYTVPDPTDILYLTRTSQARSPNNVFGQSTQDTNSPYRYSVSTDPVSRKLFSGGPIRVGNVDPLLHGPRDLPADSSRYQAGLHYPKSKATISDALKLGSSPTSLAKSYLGDTPRVEVEIDKSYPGGTSWVVFYSGTVPSSVPVAIAPIPNSSYTTSTSDMNPQRFLYLDVGNSIQSSGTYSIQVIQNTAAYGAESLGAATFNINPNFQITSEVGLTK
jgi:hypothetical protein